MTPPPTPGPLQWRQNYIHPCSQRTSPTGGGGGIISEGENFATSRNPEACCYVLVGLDGCSYFRVGSQWFLMGCGWKQRHLCPFPPPGTLLHISEFAILTCIRIHSDVVGHTPRKFRHLSSQRNSIAFGKAPRRGERDNPFSAAEAGELHKQVVP